MTLIVTPSTRLPLAATPPMPGVGKYFYDPAAIFSAIIVRTGAAGTRIFKGQARPVASTETPTDNGTYRGVRLLQTAGEALGQLDMEVWSRLLAATISMQADRSLVAVEFSPYDVARALGLYIDGRGSVSAEALPVLHHALRRLNNAAIQLVTRDADPELKLGLTDWSTHLLCDLYVGPVDDTGQVTEYAPVWHVSYPTTLIPLFTVGTLALNSSDAAVHASLRAWPIAQALFAYYRTSAPLYCSGRGAPDLARMTKLFDLDRPSIRGWRERRGVIEHAFSEINAAIAEVYGNDATSYHMSINWTEAPPRLPTAAKLNVKIVQSYRASASLAEKEALASEMLTQATAVYAASASVVNDYSRAVAKRISAQKGAVTRRRRATA